MTLAAHVPALGPVLDFLRKAARLGMEMLAALLLVFAGFRVVANARSLISRRQASDRHAPLCCLRFRAVRSPALVHAPRLQEARRRLPRPRPCGVGGRLETRYQAPLPHRQCRTASAIRLACARWGCTVGREMATAGRISCRRPFRTANAGPLTYISRTRDGGVRWCTVRRWREGRPNLLPGVPSARPTPDRSPIFFRVRAMGVSGGVRSVNGRRGSGSAVGARWRVGQACGGLQVGRAAGGIPPLPTLPRAGGRD